jgi:hypothetical protein
MSRTIDLDTLHLDTGSHRSPTHGLCLLEAVAFVAGEPHSAHPACVSPILGEFGRQLNDRLDDDRRQDLKPLITRLPGTAGDGLDETRGYLALDWLVRVYTPAWLDLAGVAEPAAGLRAVARIADMASAGAAAPAVRAASDESHAAWDAAWAAARATARDAAWATARDAGDAARAALKPTVDLLQISAIDLFTRMINPERNTR